MFGNTHNCKYFLLTTGVYNIYKTYQFVSPVGFLNVVRLVPTKLGRSKGKMG